MSRSTRKTPIMGWTTCRSERDDKQIWHRRWRAHQRTALASTPLDDEDGNLPESVKQLSDVWAMGKDGRQYWPLSSQERTAKRFARQKGRIRASSARHWKLGCGTSLWGSSLWVER